MEFPLSGILDKFVQCRTIACGAGKSLIHIFFCNLISHPLAIIPHLVQLSINILSKIVRGYSCVDSNLFHLFVSHFNTPLPIILI